MIFGRFLRCAEEKGEEEWKKTG